MRRWTACFVAAALVILFQPTAPRAQSPATPGSVASVNNPLQLVDLFRDYVEALRVQAGIPGLSVAIVGRTDVLWERGFGQQNLERAIAARADTPYQLDGLVQPMTAALVLRCVEEGRLRLDDTLGTYVPDSPDAATTIQQILGQTIVVDNAPSFLLRPTRYDLLAAPLESCSGKPLRETYTDLLDWLSMVDSVPGMDAARALVPSSSNAESKQSDSAARLERYTSVLDRLATPYFVDAQRRATPSQYSAGTLRPSSGLVSTVHDLAKFDLALRRGIVLRPETTALAWKGQVGRDEKALPYGLGWFVQSYRGEPVIWQFGISDNASSSLMVTLPSRGLTLILLANSSGLVKSFPLASGDLTASPFGRVILGFFVR